MKRVLVLAGLVAAIGTTASVASATTYDPFDGQSPVVVDADNSDGRMGVGTYFGPRQPLLGVVVTEDEVCAGFSRQIPVCV